ncbi:autophagy protein ATG11 [Aspergillus stella-maris]|uniref:autophagy protein ATG11 n=1 Tax=Aspergillus stella-maris TaxID=1810926 RepID=UPI003CCD63D4
MSLHIYIAHTGEHLLADSSTFPTTDALRSWITQNTSIPPQRQILMTARGKNVKIQTLATENELFVYDRRYVSEVDNAELPKLPSPQPLVLDNPPDTLSDQNDLQAWRNLYQARKTWASKLTARCEAADNSIREFNERTEIVNRASGVALENLKTHVTTLDNRFQEAQDWARGMTKEQQSALEGWKQALANLQNIPARNDFSFLGRPSTPRSDADRSTGTLLDYVDTVEVHKAGSEASAASSRFTRHFQDIERAVGEIANDTQRLLDEVPPPGSAGVEGLLQEVETISRKIQSDYEHVLALPNNQKTLANISRLALNHTKDLLPSMLEIGMEIREGLAGAVGQYEAAAQAAFSRTKLISSIQFRLADMQAAIANLTLESEAFDSLYFVFHMPLVYGSVLIESVRRREFNEKMKTDSLTLAEEMSVFQDEEQRRRKKWMKNMEDFISVTDTTTPGIEVNLRGHDFDWPPVERKEIELYIEELKTKPGMTNAAQELAQAFKELDAPTRVQRRRAKAFKQGSLFDLSRSSLLLHSDEMVRSLREDKIKLEEKVRGSESRIRKLEDLLHRHSHMGRPSSGNFSVDFPSSPASPHPDVMSRRSSVSSRRMSSNQTSEEKNYMNRIVHLEAELSAERETVQRLQREAHSERQTNTDKMQEVQSTKNDLIGNLEARQREFDDERRYLEGEVKRFKIRVEELEEELDRTIDGRDHEKQDADERMHQLELELQEAHVRADEEMRKASRLLEQMQSHKDAGDRFQAQVEELEKEKAEKEVERKQKDDELYNALRAAFLNLSPGGHAPSQAADIIKAIDVLTEGLTIHAKTAEDNATKAAAENKDLTEQLEKMEAEWEESKNASDNLKAELAQARGELKQEQSRVASLEAELEGERAKLLELESKLAAGETGVGALREHVAEEEQKLTNISHQLSEAEARARRSEEEVALWKERVEALSESDKQASAKVDVNTTRLGDLSSQLFSQVEKLGRMLEQLGFTVIRQDGELVVQRSSKVNALSATADQLTQSGLISVKPDASLLGWTRAKTPEEASEKFKAFMESLNQFNVDVFGDAVVKRVKDIEVLARKWQKEARGYRDKYHRVQGEAHDKIAYRSFKEGDLALFLPTRNQAIRSWAAFNVGAPHYFLREQDVHKLQTRDWLLARITKIEERVVDLSKSMNGGAGSGNPDRRSIGETSDNASIDDENPFELSDGLRWYLLDATEEKPGAPATPGLGKSTVAPAHVDARGSIRLKRTPAGGNVTKTLTRSLDSRRGSSASNRKGLPARANDSTADLVRSEGDASNTNIANAAGSQANTDEVRRDQLQGP